MTSMFLVTERKDKSSLFAQGKEGLEPKVYVWEGKASKGLLGSFHQDSKILGEARVIGWPSARTFSCLGLVDVCGDNSEA